MFNQKEYMKEYYQKHKEQHKLNAINWRKNNHDKVIASRKRYRHRHPDKWHETQKRHYNKLSQIMGELKINGCSICGYDKCDDSLSFHHVNKEDKKFEINRNKIKCASVENFVEEFHKCVLLCANCHGEITKIERNINGGKKNDDFNNCQTISRFGKILDRIKLRDIEWCFISR